MVLLALTQLGTVVLALAFAACVALVVSALWPLGWLPEDKTAERRLSWVLLAPLEFTAVWLWLNPAIYLLVWLFVFGDDLNEFRINAFVRLPAALFAVVISAAVALRLVRGAARRRFARTHLWATVFLLVMYGGVQAYDYVGRIDGITAERAAENFVARYPRHLLEGARLEERDCSSSAGNDASRHKCYWIVAGNQPKLRLSVSKIGWFAWTVSGSRPVDPAQGRLDRAKRAIRERDFDLAEFILKEVIDDYSDTADGTEARELMQSLEPKINEAGNKMGGTGDITVAFSTFCGR